MEDGPEFFSDALQRFCRNRIGLVYMTSASRRVSPVISSGSPNRDLSHCFRRSLSRAHATATCLRPSCLVDRSLTEIERTEGRRMDGQLAERCRSLPLVRCCNPTVRHAGKLPSRTGAAVVAAFVLLVAAGCAAGPASPALTPVDSTTSSNSRTAHSTPAPPAPGAAVASPVASGAGASHSLQVTTAEAIRICGGEMSGFSASIAAGQSGAPTPIMALQVFLAAPYELGYSAALELWHVKARSVDSVTYSARAASVTITELTDRTWIVISGETCAAADRPTTSPATTSSH